MYKSPITIMQGKIQTDLEDGILKAVRKVDINVDKEELLTALRFDRNQYDKGYTDGEKAMANRYRVSMILAIQEMQKYLEINDEQAKLLYHHNNEVAKQFGVGIGDE